MHRAHAGISRGRLLLQVRRRDRQGQGKDSQRDRASPRNPAGHGADRERRHFRSQGGCCGRCLAPARSRVVQRLPGPAPGNRGLVARLLVARLRGAEQRRWRGPKCRAQLLLLPLHHGGDVARQVPAQVQRHALEYRGRPAYLGRAALVCQYQLLLRSSFRCESL